MAGFYYPPHELTATLTDMSREAIMGGTPVNRVIPGIYKTFDSIFSLNKTIILKLEVQYLYVQFIPAYLRQLFEQSSTDFGYVMSYQVPDGGVLTIAIGDYDNGKDSVTVTFV